MTDVAVTTPITEAFLDALDATGRPIGDAQKPRKPDDEPHLYPYAILYVGTVRMDGTLVDPNESGLHRVQVTSIGLTRRSVEALRDLVRPILLDRGIAIDGYAVAWSELVTSQPVTRDDDVKPAVFYGVDVVNVYASPNLPGS